MAMANPGTRRRSRGAGRFGPAVASCRVGAVAERPEHLRRSLEQPPGWGHFSRTSADGRIVIAPATELPLGKEQSIAVRHLEDQLSLPRTTPHPTWRHVTSRKGRTAQWRTAGGHLGVWLDGRDTRPRTGSFAAG